MKKILMVCSCLALLLALSVPTFAFTVNNAGPTVEYHIASTGEVVSFDNLRGGVIYYASTPSRDYPYLGLRLNYSDFTQMESNSSSNPIVLESDDFVEWESNYASSYRYQKKVYFTLPAPPLCDGSTCPATDVNQDNICDDCGGVFTFNLRNDTYSFNGYFLPASIKDESGAIVSLLNYWHETLRPNGGNLVLLNGDNADSALLYYFSPNVEYRSGNVVTTGNTSVTLYKVDTDDNGNPYWYKSATDTWNTDGALVASESHIDWVAEAVPNEEGIYQITGDVNFMTPLWEKVGTATQGEMTPMSQKIVGTMKILVACSVGLMACLVVLNLFGKRSLIFRS